jgi:hypothetical protein
MEAIHENALFYNIGGDFGIFEVTSFFETCRG